MTRRPSVLLYERDDPTWRTVIDEVDGPYGFGYTCALRDIAAHLPPMDQDELDSLWHPDYTEGYLDAYDDQGRAG